LGINKNGRIQVGITNASGTRKIVSSAIGLVSVNNWNHIAMTYDGANIKIFNNGIVVATNTFSGLIRSGDTLLTIGQFQGHYFYNGLLDELKMYSRVLSDSEILAHFNMP
jgi:hypothetical protein